MDRGFSVYQLVQCELRRRPCLKHTVRLVCALWAFAAAWQAGPGGDGALRAAGAAPAVLVSAALFITLATLLMQDRDAVRGALYAAGVQPGRIALIEALRLMRFTLPGALAGAALAGAALRAGGLAHLPWTRLATGAFAPFAVTLVLGMAAVLASPLGARRGDRA